jgi:hypothetical protein
MTKWEYLQVGHREIREGELRYLVSRSGVEWSTLNELGAQGWEAVSHHGTGSGQTILFKRPLGSEE